MSFRETTYMETDGADSNILKEGSAAPARGRVSFSAFRMLGPILRPYRSRLYLAAFFLILAALTVLSLGHGLRNLIDQGFQGQNTALLNAALLYMFGAVIILAFASFGRFYFISWVGERVIADLRQRIYHHLIKMDAGYYETQKIGDLTSRITTDTTLLQVIIGSSFSIFLRNFLMMVGGLIMLVFTSPLLTAMVVLLVPAVIIPILSIGRKVRRLSKAAQEKIARIGSDIDETLYAIRTVQAFGNEEWEKKKLDEVITAAFHTSITRIKWRGLLASCVIVIAFGGVALVLWYGGHYVLEGEISPGALSAFVFYAVLVAASTGAISETIGDLQRAAGAAERLHELLTLSPKILSPPDVIKLTQPLRGHIRCENLGFCYPSRPDIFALQNFHLDIQPGEHVALVGKSGSGKSTLFQLLLRFYDPQKGRILFDNHPLCQLALSDLRTQIAYVSQDSFIFSGSIRENIRYGRMDATENDILSAARSAYALEFIEKLPQGLDSLVGERGIRLSGGQKQRLSIARALLRDTPIVLFDEATSALDTSYESLIQKALTELLRNRTAIIIAHRLSTVQNLERILVLDQGLLVGDGAHRDLLRDNLLYSELVQKKL